jgi:PilZ domain
MEHRWGQRHQLGYTASVSVGSWRAVAQVKDISISGAFLQCVAPPDSSKRLCLDFSGSQRHVVLSAQIVRRTGTGVGIEWLEFAPAPVLQMLEGFQATSTAAAASTARAAA